MNRAAVGASDAGRQRQFWDQFWSRGSVVQLRTRADWSSTHTLRPYSRTHFAGANDLGKAIGGQRCEMDGEIEFFVPLFVRCLRDAQAVHRGHREFYVGYF